MNRDLESTVWRMAQLQGAGAVFRKLIEDAVSLYKRAPGFDPSDRLHAADIGLTGFEVLRDVLERHGYCAGPPGSYVEIRSRLRAHLRYQLQWHLVSAGQGTDEMKEDQLSRDIGL
ncbi:hypothetical protein [Pseudomonas mandelii]|uniref:hypothetical protein n=1 Tax=Pseudomonas mandelii TaxID=75612 RepID=UPI00029AFA1A|nr:hypothetical protein [Pseudomonas mandelii]OYQ23322.1 hypothetical protein B7L09_08040 [Pseudomonas mandelii]